VHFSTSSGSDSSDMKGIRRPSSGPIKVLHCRKHWLLFIDKLSSFIAQKLSQAGFVQAEVLRMVTCRQSLKTRVPPRIVGLTAQLCELIGKILWGWGHVDDYRILAFRQGLGPIPHAPYRGYTPTAYPSSYPISGAQVP
jgi:hypothetical protein